MLRREPDWIVMKCLEKNRERRYETVGALAADVQRYLNDEPVQACPPSVVYRVRKFVRRHWRSLAGATVVTLLLLAVMATLVDKNVVLQQQNQVISEREKSLRRLLYVADMRMAHEAWQQGEPERMRALLARYEPEDGKEDLRTFAWHYLHHLSLQPPPEVLTGHQGDVYSVTYCPDGKEFATAGKDGTVRLWDTATGQTRRVLRVSDQEVNTAAYAPDGATLATASDDGRVKLWDRVSGLEIAMLPVYRGDVVSVVFSPDGSLLALGGGNDDASRQVRVWDRKKACESARLERGPGRIEGMAFAPNGKSLAVVSGDWQGRGLLDVWDLATHRTFFSAGFNYPTTSVAFSHDGRLLAVARGSDVEIFDAVRGQHLTRWSGHRARTQTLAFSRDDVLLASGADDGKVYLREVSTGQMLDLRSVPGQRIWCLAFGANDATLTAATSSGAAVRWPLAADLPGRVQLAMHHEGFVELGPLGRTALTFLRDKPAALWDLASGKRLVLTPVWNGLTTPCFSADGTRILDLGKDHTVRVWDTATGTCRHSFAADAVNLGACLDPSGQVVALWNNTAVQFCDLKTGQKHLIDVDALGRMAFSPDGKFFVTIHGDGSHVIWDLPAKVRRHVLPMPIGIGSSNESVITGAGDVVAVGDPEIKLWDTRTGQALQTLNGRRFSCAVFSPDGSTLATAELEPTCTIKLWDRRTGLELFTFPVAGKHVSTLAFMADGTALLAGVDAPSNEVLRWSASKK
jgi:WD40 repeat protein